MAKVKKENYFSQKWQLNARIKKKYDGIAANIRKCVFCDLKEKYLVSQNKGAVLTVNLFPYTNGHLLVIPNRHTDSYTDLTKEEIVVCHHLLKRGIRLLRKRLRLENFWLLLREGEKVGKTVKHLHWQIIPYFEGLVDWHYQEVDLLPEKLAKILKLRK